MAPEWAKRRRWLQPFAQNHTVSAELLLIENATEANQLADYLKMVIRRVDIKMQGCAVRAAVETSPKRRDHLRMWQLSRELPVQLNPGKHFGAC